MASADKWSPDEVAANLYQIGLGKYGRTFVENGINGKALFALDDLTLRNLGMSVNHRTQFSQWVGGLKRPRQGGPAVGRPAAQPARNSSPRYPTKPPVKVPQVNTRASARPSNSNNRLFTQSLRKPVPRDEWVERRPVQTGAQRYGHVEEEFDIRELAFTPMAPVKTIPKRIPIRPRRGAKFNVPEDGSTDNRVQCRFCGRNFAADRIAVHEGICCRCSKPRRVFNSQRQRLAGTGATGYSRMAPPPKVEIRGEPSYRVEHERLVALLRAARGAKVSKKMRQLIDEAPSRDYREECPYCGRRFGPEQLERHRRSCMGSGMPSRARVNMSTCSASKKNMARTAGRRRY